MESEQHQTTKKILESRWDEEYTEDMEGEEDRALRWMSL
jgi:hypothetical protein